MDRQYRANRAGVGALHCIPIVLKDNFNTVDMPTTGGNVGMKDSRPAADAFTVAKLRKAGALILGKANLQEFARGGMSTISLGGQVLNPYDLTRTPGGSSAAAPARRSRPTSRSRARAAIRANRSAHPSSANNLVGVRPTRGLVSRSGVIPNSQTQDEVGPIARTVTDAALMLDVMAGYDAADPITAFGRGRISRRATRICCSADALKGARIGVMTNLVGKARASSRGQQRRWTASSPGWSRGAPRSFASSFPNTTRSCPAIDTHLFEARTVMERYFAALGPDAPVKTFVQLVAAKTSAVQKTLEAELAIVDGMNSQTYKDRMLNRDKLRLAVATKIADLNLDAILYPLQKILVVPITAGDQAERNGTLSNGTGFPAVTFPAGFSAPSASAPRASRSAASCSGSTITEDRLLAYAYAFEQTAELRKSPASTPPLPNEP